MENHRLDVVEYSHLRAARHRSRLRELKTSIEDAAKIIQRSSQLVVESARFLAQTEGAFEIKNEIADT